MQHKKTLFLHIGMEKTGSTAFQEALVDNSSVHGKKILFYGNTTNINLVKALLEYFNSSSLWSKKMNESGITLISLFQNDLKRFSNQDIILSSEHFSGRFNKNDIDKLIRMISSTHIVELLIVDRDNKDWMVSKYKQAIKAGYSNLYEDYTSYVNHDWFSRNNKKSILHDWQNKDVAIKKFIYSHNIVNKLLNYLELDLVDTKKKNISLSESSLKILRKFNSYVEPHNHKYTRRLLAKILERLF